jgi:hypothetical protein
MCEIIHPKGGKLGKYRTMFQGKYYIFRAAGKSDAWGMFHKELADSGKLTDEEVLRVGAALSRNRADEMDEAVEIDKRAPGHARRVLDGMKSPTTIEATTINQAVQQFLTRQRARVAGGTLSAGRYDVIARGVEHFANFVGKTCSPNRITGSVLEGYSSMLLEKTTSTDG